MKSRRLRIPQHPLFAVLAAIAFLIGASASRLAAQDGLLQLGGPGGAEADLVKASGYFLPATGGKPAVLVVTADVASGWHIYSITQASGGPIKTKIKLTPSPDYKLAGDFKPLKPPEVHHYEDIYPNLPVEEHQGQVMWAAPIEIAASVDPAKLEIAGAVSAQVCSTSCLAPKDYKFVARLGKVGAENVAINSVISAATTPAQNAVPAGVAVFKSNLSHAALSGRIEPAVAAPGTIARLVITADPAPGWHIYALTDKDPNDVSKPTLIALTNTTGLRYKPAKPNAPPIEKTTSVNASGKVQYYEKPVSWTVELEVPRDAKPGNFPIAGIIGYQTCEETACDPPLAARFEGVLTVGNASDNSAAPILFSSAKYGDAAKLAAQSSGENQTPDGSKSDGSKSSPASVPTNSHSESPHGDAPPVATRGGFDESLIARNVQTNYSAIQIVLGAFFGGMLLNLMPCVFPVIGLKILSFVEQSHHDRRRLLTLNLWYSLGVLVVFLGLAAVAVGLRQFVGIDFKYGNQNGIQGYAIGMAAVMFVMGLSLLNVWEIPIPGFLGSGKAGEMMMHEGAAGAVAKGVITTLLGASCSAPVVAVAFTFALDRSTPVWATFATFAIVGVGMSSPYLILGANPRLLRFLPKPGAWMDTFKHICGFVLLGAMVWVLTWLQLPYVAPTVAFLVGLWAACWWIGRVPLTEPGSKRLRTWAEAAIFSAAVGYFAFGVLAPAMTEKFDDVVSAEIAKRIQSAGQPGSAQATGNRLPWQPFTKDLLKQLTQQRKTVMVDFTADWCPNCKALEHAVLNTADVKAVVTHNDVVPLVADYTEIPPELTEMLNLLKAGAVPVLAIFPANDPNNPIIFRGGYTQSTLIDALNKAGPSQSMATKETVMQ